MQRWCVPAYAKINLGLRVRGKRPDGYHELDTYFLQVNLADELFFQTTSREGMELSCSRSDIPCDDSNLCVRTYNAAARRFGRPARGAARPRRPGIRLHLAKRIPAGGGLGGGSSDAAVTLMVLDQIWGASFSRDDLHRIALEIGSDVPFFLEGGMCHGAGRGEILSPVPVLPELWIVLVIPDIVISTRWVYQNIKFGLTKKQKSTTLKSLDPERFDTYSLISQCQNDLEEGVFAFYPELARIKARMMAGGALVASMTGSGSTVFGLFDSLEKGEHVACQFRPDFETHVVRPVKWGGSEISEHLLSSSSGW